MTNDKIIIGVIGQGFVGSSVARAFSGAGYRVETYDKYVHERSTTDLAGIAKRCDIVFVCVPTPADKDGRCCTNIVRSVVSELYDRISIDPLGCRCNTIVIKSTVPPRTTDMLLIDLHEKAPHVTLIFNPEFLNARSAYDDFIHQDHVILGVARIHQSYQLPDPEQNVSVLIDAYVDMHSHYNDDDVEVIVTSADNAEAVKYIRNCFFATKVSFFNEMYDMCRALDIVYDDVIDIVRKDGRVGFEHTRVPGPSPDPEGLVVRGFGGMCLPKDLQEFIHLAEDHCIEPLVMKAAWKKNLQVRPGRDWERVPGASLK